MTETYSGLYPGTFDPITFGHIEIIQRALRMFDQLTICVAEGHGKNPLFSLEERVETVTQTLNEILPNKARIRIKIIGFSGLLVECAQRAGVNIIIRGLRAASDFEHEFQQAWMNAKLDASIETVFLMSSERYQFISSRFVKEIAALGGNTSKFVPQKIALMLDQKLREN